MEKKFAKIKKHYDDFHKDMHSKGRMMLKDTGIGYWGISPATELFELFKLTKLDKHKKFIDLGSGDGRAAIIASLFTDSTGIEFDKELHDFAAVFAKKLGSKAKMLNEDYMGHSLVSYDYIFINPDKGIAGELEDKMLKEMKHAAKLVVYGPHSHPKSMKKKDTIEISGTLISIFSKK
jgi:protein-L-isoaspartate O-methyltransferase